MTKNQATKHVVVTIIAMIIMVLLGQTTAVAAEQYPVRKPVQKIGSTQFGIHSFHSQPEIPAGAFRMNCFPTWGMMNPQQGKYDWKAMDTYLSQVESWGYKDILFSLCGTPKWAGKKLSNPTLVPHFGDGASAAPRNIKYWQQFVNRFAKRYADRLTSIEVWNEATSLYQWQGTPKEMAIMTNRVYKIFKRENPNITIISADVQTGQPGWVKRFFPPYIKELKKRNWPIDAVAFHTYSGADLNEREGMLKYIHSLLIENKIPKKIPVWDTEVNYIGNFTPQQVQKRVARTFLDSWRYGIKRTYWYVWTSVDSTDVWGIPTRPGSPATEAYKRIVSWTKNSRLEKCTTTKNNVVSCSFKNKTGKNFMIVWQREENKTNLYTVPNQYTQQCFFETGTCESIVGKISITDTPTKVI